MTPKPPIPPLTDEELRKCVNDWLRGLQTTEVRQAPIYKPVSTAEAVAFVKTIAESLQRQLGEAKAAALPKGCVAWCKICFSELEPDCLLSTCPIRSESELDRVSK